MGLIGCIVYGIEDDFWGLSKVGNRWEDLCIKLGFERVSKVGGKVFIEFCLFLFLLGLE